MSDIIDLLKLLGVMVGSYYIATELLRWWHND